MNTHLAVGNAVDDSEAVKAGALCYIVNFSIATGSVEVYVVNREAEWISEWRPGSSVTNFRAKVVKQGHPAYRHALSSAAARARASMLAKAFMPPKTDEEDAAPSG